MTALEFYKAFYLQLLQGEGGFPGAGEQEGVPGPSHLMGSGGNLWIVLPQSSLCCGGGRRNGDLLPCSPRYLFHVVSWAPILLCQACCGKDR